MTTETTLPVYVVTVEGRDDGIYLFRDLADARRFRDAVIADERDPDTVHIGEQPIIGRRIAAELVAQELADVLDS